MCPTCALPTTNHTLMCPTDALLTTNHTLNLPHHISHTNVPHLRSAHNKSHTNVPHWRSAHHKSHIKCSRTCWVSQMSSSFTHFQLKGRDFPITIFVIQLVPILSFTPILLCVKINKILVIELYRYTSYLIFRPLWNPYFITALFESRSQVADSCECGHESSTFINCEYLLDYPRNYHALRKVFVPWSS